MDCKEFEKLIPDFIHHRMDYPTLKQFAEHVRTCDDCKEELTIQFLVTEGIQRLESGSAFNLQKELDLRLSEAEYKLKVNGFLLSAGAALELVAFCAIVGFVIWILL